MINPHARAPCPLMPKTKNMLRPGFPPENIFCIAGFLFDRILIYY